MLLGARKNHRLAVAGKLCHKAHFSNLPLSILAVVAALALHLDSDVNGIHGLSYGLLPGKVGIASNLLLIQNLTYTKSIVNVLWSLPF